MKNKLFKLLAIAMLVLMVFSSCDLMGSKTEEPPAQEQPQEQPQEKTYIWAIGEEKFETIQEAVNYIHNGKALSEGTIKLLKNAEGEGVEVSFPANITFDLNGFSYGITKGSNGFDFTNVIGNHAIQNGQIWVGNDVNITSVITNHSKKLLLNGVSVAPASKKDMVTVDAQRGEITAVYSEINGKLALEEGTMIVTGGELDLNEIKGNVDNLAISGNTVITVNTQEVFDQIEELLKKEEEKQEQPGQEQPGQEQPGQEQPGQEQPGQEQPGQEQPTIVIPEDKKDEIDTHHQHKFVYNYNDQRNSDPEYFIPGRLFKICSECHVSEYDIIPSTVGSLSKNVNNKDFTSDEYMILDEMTTSIGQSFGSLFEVVNEFESGLGNIGIMNPKIDTTIEVDSLQTRFDDFFYSKFDVDIIINPTSSNIVGFNGSYNFGYSKNSQPYTVNFVYGLSDNYFTVSTLTGDVLNSNDDDNDAFRNLCRAEKDDIEELTRFVLANSKYTFVGKEGTGAGINLTIKNGAEEHPIDLSITGGIELSDTFEDEEQTIIKANDLKITLSGIDIVIDLSLPDTIFVINYGSDDSYTLFNEVNLSIKYKDELEIKTVFDLSDKGLNFIINDGRYLDLIFRGRLANETSVIVGDNKISLKLDANPYVEYRENGNPAIDLSGVALNDLSINMNGTPYNWDSIIAYFFDNDNDGSEHFMSAGEHLRNNILKETPLL